MARIRTIKPDFWTDAALMECSLNARLLFIGTWNFADDQGNFDRSAKQIKARVFPADSVDCEPLLRELIAHGLLTEYSVNGKNYLHILGFTKHQVINRPGKPVCPPYDDSLKVHGKIIEPSLPEGKGREGNGKGKEKTKSRFALPEWVPSEAWTSYLETRKKKRAPNTDHALTLAVEELEKLRGQGHDPKAVLEQSVFRGWQGLFPIGQQSGATPDYTAVLAKYAEGGNA